MNFSVHMAPETVRQIESLAKKMGKTRNALVNIAVEEAPVPHRSTGDSSTAEATSTATSKATPGQRRPAASEVTSAA